MPEYEAKHGGPLYKTNPDQCCFDRKINVLQRGRRGFARLDERHPPRPEPRPGPGADRRLGQEVRAWSKSARWPTGPSKDVWKRDHSTKDIPYNPLHDQGYPSIGCWPCTRAVAAGETDERAGRWSGAAKTECGLHSLARNDGSGI